MDLSIRRLWISGIFFFFVFSLFSIATSVQAVTWSGNDGTYTGNGTCRSATDPSKRKYTGNFSSGALDGRGIYNCENGNTLQASFQGSTVLSGTIITPGGNTSRIQTNSDISTACGSPEPDLQCSPTTAAVIPTDVAPVGDTCGRDGSGNQCIARENCELGNIQEGPGLCSGSGKVCCKSSLFSQNLQQDIRGLNKVGTTSLPTLIGKLITVAMGILGSTALVVFLYGGVTWMLARGNAELVGQAVKTMIWASLGLAVIFASYAAVTFLFGTFK